MSKEETKEEFNFKDKKAWQTALNEAPNDSWIKERKLGASKSSRYISIPIQQALADVFFDEFDVIDASFQQICNEILCTVKISCLPSYPNSEHRIISGTGAKPISAASGSTAAKFPMGKITNSLEYCAPNARVAAISNALTTIGNVFGRNIGREVSSGHNFADKKKKKKDEKK